MSHDPLAEMEAGVVAETDVRAPVGATGTAEPDAGGPVELGDSLTIPEVAETLERLRSALDLGGSLHLRAGALEHVDTSGVQLLCAVVKEARSRSQAVAWDGASEALRLAARQLGLEQDLAF